MFRKTLTTILLLPLIFLVFTQCTSPEKGVEEIEGATPAKKVIVLAVDGGGIKGVIPAIFIDSIEKKVGKPSFQTYDVIGGTSTGGIISVALVTPSTHKMPYTGEEIVQIYKTKGGSIFVPQKCKVDFCATYFADDGKGAGVEPYLQSMVGSATSLTDSEKYIQGLAGYRTKQMFTTSYIVNSKGNVVTKPILGTDYGPHLFNWYDAGQHKLQDYYLWEAARGTSAAPTYFPIAQVGGGTGKRSSAPQKWVVDGGMMSNDPAVWGVTEALRTGLAKSLDEIIVVSLGTGVYPGGAGVGIHNNSGGLYPDNGNWSEYPWVVAGMYDLEGNKNNGGTVVNVILDAVQLVTNDQMDALRKGGLDYYRLEPELAAAQGKMDDTTAANINSLIKTANTYLTSAEGSKTLSDIVTALKNN